MLNWRSWGWICSDKSFSYFFKKKIVLYKWSTKKYPAEWQSLTATHNCLNQFDKHRLWHPHEWQCLSCKEIELSLVTTTRFSKEGISLLLSELTIMCKFIKLQFYKCWVLVISYRDNVCFLGVCFHRLCLLDWLVLKLVQCTILMNKWD